MTALSLRVLGLAGLFCLLALPGFGQQIPVLDDGSTSQVDDMLHKASDEIDSGHLDEALRDIDAALQIDPRKEQAYELRGSIYIQKKLWDRAQDDYLKALQIAPSIVALKYKLGEIKFLQKDYEAARARFEPLQKDPDLGRLATYQMFLCDLVTNEADAGHDLDQINKGEKNEDYYYCNAIWNHFHHKEKEANDFFGEAAQLYGSNTTSFYLASLKELNYVQIPIASFSTKDGLSFTQARVYVEDTGLRISTSQGWISIAFDRLGNLSGFPDDVRRQIETRLRRDAGAASSLDLELLSFTTKQGKRYDHVRWSLDEDGLKILTEDGHVIVPLDQLPDDISGFPVELAQRIGAIRQAADSDVSKKQPLTFTTKTNKKYEQVKWSLGVSGLRILTPDGWEIVPFDQLPDDIGGFPIDLRKSIQTRRHVTSVAVDNTSLLTFTTKRGKLYDHVKWSTDDVGVGVLTPEGWTTIPLAQLPDDLTAFPPLLRQHVEFLRTSRATAASDPELLTFTTRKGVVYDQVRWSLSNDGLRILTPDGWTTVPFEQLPQDLSAFSLKLRQRISDKIKAVAERKSAAAHPDVKPSPTPAR